MVNNQSASCPDDENENDIVMVIPLTEETKADTGEDYPTLEEVLTDMGYQKVNGYEK
jgi:hypothetical protein